MHLNLRKIKLINKNRCQFKFGDSKRGENKNLKIIFLKKYYTLNSVVENNCEIES